MIAANVYRDAATKRCARQMLAAQ